MKSKCVLILAACLSLVAGCRQAEPTDVGQNVQNPLEVESMPYENVGNIALVEEEDNSTDNTNDALPLQLGESIIRTITINEMEELFGDDYLYTTLYLGDPLYCGMIEICYPDLGISLWTYEGLSFIEQEYALGEQEWNYESAGHILTEQDKDVTLYVSTIHWDRESLVGPRGIKIGDSYDDVKNKYLDLSQQYSEPVPPYDFRDYELATILENLYLPQDVVEDYDEALAQNDNTVPLSFSFGVHIVWDTESPEYLYDADSVLEYHVSKESRYDHEATYFYIKDNVVIHIEPINAWGFSLNRRWIADVRSDDMLLEAQKDSIAGREEEICSLVHSIKEERLSWINDVIMECYHQDKTETGRTFQAVIESCVDQASVLQPDKGKIGFVVLSGLHSSLVLDKWELRVEVMNQHHYLDEYEAAAYWKPQFLQPCWQEEKAFAAALLRSKLLRVKEYEIVEVTRQIASWYYEPLRRVLRELCQGVGWQAYWGLLAPPVQVMYGSYMEKATQIFKVE